MILSSVLTLIKDILAILLGCAVVASTLLSLYLLLLAVASLRRPRTDCGLRIADCGLLTTDPEPAKDSSRSAHREFAKLSSADDQSIRNPQYGRSSSERHMPIARTASATRKTTSISAIRNWKGTPGSRFAILIPAHEEELVIGRTPRQRQ